MDEKFTCDAYSSVVKQIKGKFSTPCLASYSFNFSSQNCLHFVVTWKDPTNAAIFKSMYIRWCIVVYNLQLIVTDLWLSK